MADGADALAPAASAGASAAVRAARPHYCWAASWCSWWSASSSVVVVVRRAGRAGFRGVAGALLSMDQLDDAVDDQRDQDQNEHEPADEQHGLAVPGGGLGFLVDRVDRFGLLEPIGRVGWGNGWRGFTGRRVSAHAVVGMLGRLIVEVVPIGCHGTDGTDAVCQSPDVSPQCPGRSVRGRPAQKVLTLSMLTNMPCPVWSLVKRVPSGVAFIVQPCAA